MVTAVASLAAFLQVLGGACTQASNSLVTGRGEGWGYTLFLWQPEGRHGQAGLSQGPAFSFSQAHSLAPRTQRSALAMRC
ncbi:hypothetical protein XI09_05835 [Bradyrhizobium sp. CCBAU 11386]|nr:hypothetical protein [Bradyrhizobium sp. CCBAU 11386]